MRKLFFLLCLVALNESFAQTKPALVYSTDVNTVGDASIIISIIPEKLESKIASINDGVSFKIRNGNEDLVASLPDGDKKVSHSRTSIKLRLTNLTTDQLRELQTGLGSSVLIFSKDLEIELEDETVLTYTQEEIATSSEGNLLFSEEQRQNYIEASGGDYAFMKNRMEFGVIPKSESDDNEYNFMIDFAYRKAYNFINGNKAYFTTEGVLSTNKNDSLNIVKIFPLSYRLTSTSNKSETVIETGIEGNQDFDYWRISANLEYRLIFQNLVDLTGGSNRLRLKPVVTAGLKIYSEQDNERPDDIESNETSGQVFGKIYYVIPVFDSFTIVADAMGFYDLNDSVNPEEEFKFNYRISFGYEVEGKGFQALITYRNGATEVNYQTDELISFGIFAQLSK
ncbi:hypothetical protein E1176_16600 [Fulvivirga sp. RKSG066]|uniref:hypothetical protein n=1 Tax=Fulvivirga aurantia TaxID=2529383 RepID=UPI0012BBB4ED|nr:hypothetical protein [Fulvivirga aurantia]MTI22654.1 hypothetical protein [Fulvivirga aurantia]